MVCSYNLVDYILLGLVAGFLGGHIIILFEPLFCRFFSLFRKKRKYSNLFIRRSRKHPLAESFRAWAHSIETENKELDNKTRLDDLYIELSDTVYQLRNAPDDSVLKSVLKRKVTRLTALIEIYGG